MAGTGDRRASGDCEHAHPIRLSIAYMHAHSDSSKPGFANWPIARGSHVFVRNSYRLVPYAGDGRAIHGARADAQLCCRTPGQLSELPVTLLDGPARRESADVSGLKSFWGRASFVFSAYYYKPVTYEFHIKRLATTIPPSNTLK